MILKESFKKQIWKLLTGSVWHTTSIDRYNSILSDGEIKPEPNIPEGERWGMSYVRKLGGISLFDFVDFNIDEYERDYPAHSLYHFIPCKTNWENAVWIEIDTAKLKMYIDGKFLRDKWFKGIWKETGKYMGVVEGCHIGPMHIDNFKRVFIINHHQLLQG